MLTTHLVPTTRVGSQVVDRIIKAIMARKNAGSGTAVFVDPVVLKLLIIRELLFERDRG